MATIGDYRGSASLLDVLGAIAINKKKIENIKRTFHDALNEKPCKFVGLPPHITETFS